MKFNNEIYKIHEVNNFRDIIKATVEKYPDNVAYKFKKNFKKDDECVVEKKYKRNQNGNRGIFNSIIKSRIGK